MYKPYIYIFHIHNWGILSYYGHYSFPKPVPPRLPRPESDDPELQSLPVPCGGVGYMEDLLGISWGYGIQHQLDMIFAAVFHNMVYSPKRRNAD